MMFLILSGLAALNIAFYAQSTHRWWNLAAGIFCALGAIRLAIIQK